MLVLAKIQKNPVFKFVSSIRLAVPLLTLFIITIAAGTIVETRFNTDLARLIFYDSNWFRVFIFLLWVNIFSATLSRYPFQKHHTGFVITHIGLLTLLIGAMITSVCGIDGQLRIEEGTTNRQLVLPDLVLERSEITENQIHKDILPIQKPLWVKNLVKKFGSGAAEATKADRWGLQKILPFSQIKDDFVESKNPNSGAVVGVFLKSPFFSVGEVLHSKSKSRINLGPARLELNVVDETTLARPRTNSPSALIGNDESVLIVRDWKTKKEVAQIQVQQLKKKMAEMSGVQIRFAKSFEQALVRGKSQVFEGGTPNANPALELEVSKQGKTIREVVFSEFKDFSMHSEGIFGLAFEYLRTAGEKNRQPMMKPGGGGPMGDHLILLSYDPNKPNQVRVEFRKDSKLVGSEIAFAGSTIQSPWMGMTVGIGTLMKSGEIEKRIVEAALRPGEPLPQSSVELRPPGWPESFWLTEEESKDFEKDGKKVTFFYGRKKIILPFSLTLKAFSKKDYLGTETPMSFESEVLMDGDSNSRVISMNEPLKKGDYTIYQSSYDQHEGRSTASIFSVNKDPGRPWKYLGSLILGVGIITYTVMKSRLNRKRVNT